jgi:hypothetical protein
VVSLWEMPLYIDGCFFEWDPVLVLMHFTVIPGSGVAPGCRDVILPVPLFHIVSYLEPMVSLLDLI